MSLCARNSARVLGSFVSLSKTAVLPRTNNKHVFTPDVFNKRVHNIGNGENQDRLLQQWSCGVEHFGKLKMDLPFDTHVSCLNPQLYPDMNSVIIRMFYTAPDIPSGDELHEFLSGLVKMYEIKFDTQNSIRPKEIIVDGKFKAARLPIECRCEIPLKFDLDIKCSECATVIQGMESDVISVNAKSCTFISTKSGIISAECNEGDLVCQNLLQGNLSLQAKGKSNIITDRLQGTDITCSTENGDITCSSVYSSTASFTSRHGNIKLSNCHADSHVTVPEGNLTIDSFEGNLNAEVKKGSTDIFITRPENVKVKSETGDISIRVDKTINSGFELQGKTVTVDDTLGFQEESSKDTKQQNVMKGCVNRNQAIISAETSEGRVQIKQQDWFQSLNLKFQSG